MFIAQPLRRLFPAVVLLAAISLGQPFGTWKLKVARSTLRGTSGPTPLPPGLSRVPEARLSQCTGPRSTARRAVAAWFYTSTAWPEVFSKASAQGRNPHGGLTARPLKSCATVGLVLGPGSSGGVRQKTNSFWRFLNNVLTAAASAVG